MANLTLLHTSDWHLGAEFHEQVRDAEESLALDSIVAMARQHLVDAVVIAGDIFDSVNPPASAQERYFRTLARLTKDAGVGTVLVIGGNHDHGVRLDAPRHFLEGHRIHVRGCLPRTADPASVVVPVFPRSGGPSPVAWAALVPYLRDGDLLLSESGAALEDLSTRQAVALRERLTSINLALRTQAESKPMIAVAHAFASGGRLGSTERPVFGEDIVGRLGKTDLSPLAAGCAYLALGHLHRAQTIGGYDHWRYSGSLMPMAMDECMQRRQICIVKIPLQTTSGGRATVTNINLPVSRRYARLQGDADAVRAQIRALPPPNTDELEPFCDVQIVLPQEDPSIVREIEDLIAERKWRHIAIRRIRPATTTAQTTQTTGDHIDLQQMEPTQIFSQVLNAQGVAMTAELDEDFRALLASALMPS